MAKIDWPQKTFGLNYPQTDVAQKAPSDVTISVNGFAVETVHLPDDPADARGVLSHHAGIDPGAYGYPIEVQVVGDALAGVVNSKDDLVIRFEVAADAEYRGGVALYGARRGSVPIDPTLFFEIDT